MARRTRLGPGGTPVSDTVGTTEPTAIATTTIIYVIRPSENIVEIRQSLGRLNNILSDISRRLKALESAP